MPTVTLAPCIIHEFYDSNGDPANGAQLFVYAAGTTTKVNTWSDATATALNSNPIVLDAAGRCEIWLEDGSYKFVLAPSTDTDPPTSPYWTRDVVASVPATGTNIEVAGIAGETVTTPQLVYIDNGSGGTAGRWYKASNFTLAKSIDAGSWGFVQTDAATGEDITVRTAGRQDLAGPLTPGAIYYASDTAGALETGAPSPETDSELILPIGIADSSTSIVFPLKRPAPYTRDALKTLAFASGQSNAAGGADSELTSYEVLIPANYLDAAGAGVCISGEFSVAANGDAKTVKIAIGGGSKVTMWSSSANVANHVVPFRWEVRRRTSTTGSVAGITFHGVASGNNASAYMVYTTLGTVDWTTNQLIKLYCAANTVTSVTFNDLSVTPIRSENAGSV